MKIAETRPVAASARVRREDRGARAYADAQARGSSAPSDSATVAGIPEDELTPKVQAAISALMREVDRLRSELEHSKSRLNQLEQLADQDALTPVSNRRAFVRELTRIVSFAERYNVHASLIYFDINAFKLINDQYGHGGGDAALIKVADTLNQQVRESDVVGRLGGDEFGVILSHANERQAHAKAQQLTDAVRRAKVEFEGKVFEVSVSYGVTTFEPGVSAKQAMAAADQAMYAHKKGEREEH